MDVVQKAKAQENERERLATGEKILQSLPNEVKEQLGTASGNIKFLNLLGDPFTTTPIIGKGNQPMEAFKNVPVTIGALFEAKAPVKVPVINAAKKATEAITASELTWRDVAAGEKFALTLLEIYVLAIQPEYSLYFGADVNGEFNEKGAKVVLKWPNPSNGQSTKIPTATFAVADKILRTETVPVCSGERTAPVWTDPMYEKFAPKIIKSNTRTGGTSQNPKDTKIENAKKTALYCRELLNQMLSSSAQ